MNSRVGYKGAPKSVANNKQRYVNTKFWNDSYIAQLDPIEKMLFIYFLTNGHTNIAGIYEVPMKVIAVETGIEVSMINKILPRLKEKIRYIDGKVVIKNFIKHQENSSDKVKAGILNCLKEFSSEWLGNIVNKGFFALPRYYMDTLSIPYAYDQNYLDLDSNLDSNLDSDLNSPPAEAPTDSAIPGFDLFWSAYPKKELKRKAKIIWATHHLEPKTGEILAFVEKAKLTDRWLSGFIKHPTTFLNGECWNDDLAAYSGSKKPGFVPYVAKDAEGKKLNDYSKSITARNDE